MKQLYLLTLLAILALTCCKKDDSTDTPPPAPEPTLKSGTQRSRLPPWPTGRFRSCTTMPNPRLTGSPSRP